MYQIANSMDEDDMYAQEIPGRMKGEEEDDLDLGPVNSIPVNPLFQAYVLETLRTHVGRTQEDLKEGMTANQIMASGLGLAEALVSTLLLMRVQQGHVSFGDTLGEGNFGPRGSALKAQEAHLLTANKALKRALRLFMRPDEADLRPGGRLKQSVGSAFTMGETAATFGLKQLGSMFAPFMDQMGRRDDTRSKITALSALLDQYAQRMKDATTPEEKAEFRAKYAETEAKLQALVEEPRLKTVGPPPATPPSIEPPSGGMTGDVSAIDVAYAASALPDGYIVPSPS